ncbi:MAG: hypothetical protein VX474_05030 [Pseudomonadota bacterium]|nr:hypothetical protein [Pseudomonadota bacterium]MEC8103532.1 hypothetical protein [Pseudomonadota bacterium]MEE2749316.1 hypothetical protein [Pseudomonadota bacterium]
MTRKKKTRSLSRIHNVKTGSIKKLKRESGNDRQSGKRVARKNKSVFEKFLESNPEAKQQLNTEQKQARENNSATAKTVKSANSSQKGSSQPGSSQKTSYNEERAADSKDAKTSQSRQQEQDKRVERDDDLLGMLDSIKRDEDLY